MISFLLVTGPPFDTPLWSGVVDRIHSQGHKATAFQMLMDGDGSIENESKRLAEQIHQTGKSVVLIAHGSAIPTAIKASSQATPAGLVLSNGPFVQVDMLTKTLARWAQLPKTVTETILSSKRSMRLLSSSLGLRRLVVNPYVMDHDTTVTICGPIFDSGPRTARMRNYLKTLSKTAWLNTSIDTPTLLCWGDADPLTIRNVESFMNSKPNGVSHEAVPGGRYLHPVERPWELADRCISWAENSLTTT